MPTRGDIEKFAEDLLTKHGLDNVPVQVDELARAEGLAVVQTSFAKSDVSGALIKSRHSSGIAVNGAHHPNRRRFTVAHELGHFFLKHEGKENHMDWQFTVLRRDGVSSEASDVSEIEANYFAASLLMPKSKLFSDVLELRSYTGEASVSDVDVELLARKYQVSQAAMKYRLINLGLTSPL